ncbi:CPBP family intramembrane metalloprotease, partial [Massilia arenosa]
LSAWAARQPVAPALRPQLVPGLLGGLAGAALIALTGYLAPPALQQLAATVSMPALARVLYGGVTEELLMRWGAMTFFAWLFWRVFQRRAAAGAGVMVAAIAVAALGFGIGHLPAAATLLGQLTPGVIVYVVLGNATFGFIAGALYWKVGLEAAIIAHMGAHTVLLLSGF